MWRAQAGHKIQANNDSDDDWETEADFENTADDSVTKAQARTFGDKNNPSVVNVRVLLLELQMQVDHFSP